MDRRSPPQKKLDDRAFRVGVHMLMPERGFANPLLDMHRCSTPKSAGATSPRTARQRPDACYCPQNQPSRLMMMQCESLFANPPNERWQAVYMLESK